MPSQEEVLEAAKKLKAFTVKELKKHFGMDHLRGSSHLSDRLKKLHRRGYLVKVRIPGGALYIVPPEYWDDVTRADEFLYYVTNCRNRRCRRYSEDLIMKVSNALYAEKQSISEVAKRAGVKWHTAKKYLQYLAEKGIIFHYEEEHRGAVKKKHVFTVYSLQ